MYKNYLRIIYIIFTFNIAIPKEIRDKILEESDVYKTVSESVYIVSVNVMNAKVKKDDLILPDFFQFGKMYNIKKKNSTILE